MLFEGGITRLVSLSNTLEVQLTVLANFSNQYLKLVEPYSSEIARMRAEIRQAMEDGSGGTYEPTPPWPLEVAEDLAEMEWIINSLSVTTVLLSSFVMESYINSLAHYVEDRPDLLGLTGKAKEYAAGLLFKDIEKSSTREKWDKVASLSKGEGFEKGRVPFQDMNIVFNFRNDWVHDKLITFSDDSSDDSSDEEAWPAQDRLKKRYGEKLPPFPGFANLRHGLFAAQTYWGMALEVLKLLEISREDFHRHYDLSPWGKYPENELEQLSDDIHKALGG